MIFLLCLLPSFCFVWWRYIKHSRQCFIRYLNTLNFVINTLLRVACIFNSLLGVSNPDEKMSLVFDILLHYRTESNEKHLHYFCYWNVKSKMSSWAVLWRQKAHFRFSVFCLWVKTGLLYENMFPTGPFSKKSNSFLYQMFWTRFHLKTEAQEITAYSAT